MLNIILNFGGTRRSVTVADLKTAREVFIEERDTGYDGFGWGASDMGSCCGQVFDARTREWVATVMYNGRVLDLAGLEVSL